MKKFSTSGLFGACVGFCLSHPVLARNESLHFTIQAIPEWRRYIGFLEYPPLLALGLENSGIRLSHAGRIKILDRHTLELSRENPIPFKKVLARFVKREGPRYYYEVVVDWRVGLLAKNMALTAVLNTTPAHPLDLRVNVSNAEFVPLVLTRYIDTKIKVFLGNETQQNLVTYLDALGSPGAKKPEESFEKILMYAYNASTREMSGVPQRLEGDSETVAEQLALLITLAIWLILVPVLYLVFFLRRRLKKRCRQSDSKTRLANKVERQKKIRWCIVDGASPEELDLSSRSKMHEWFKTQK